MSVVKFDKLIDSFINDANYRVSPNGLIWKHQKYCARLLKCVDAYGYSRIAYKNVHLKAHRIVYAKYKGELQSGMVIDHINNDNLDNNPSNLQQITNRANTEKNTKPKPSKNPQIKLRSPKRMKLIDEIVNDPNYDIREDGTIWTKIRGFQWRIGYIIGKDWKPTGLTVDNHGYFVMTYKKQTLPVSNIIYQKFNEALDNKSVIDHIDNNPQNNDVSNLQQITYAENGRKSVFLKVSHKIAEQIRKEYNEGVSQRVLKTKYGTTSAGGIVRNEQWIHESNFID